MEFDPDDPLVICIQVQNTVYRLRARDRADTETWVTTLKRQLELANNHELRKDVEGQILEALPNLWRRPDAVEEWEKILLRVSPVKQCEADDSNGKDEL